MTSFWVGVLRPELRSTTEPFVLHFGPQPGQLSVRDDVLGASARRRFGTVFFRPALHKVVIQVAKLCNGNQRVLGEREKPSNNAAGGDGPLVGVHFLLAAFARPARLVFGGVALLAEAGRAPAALCLHSEITVQKNDSNCATWDIGIPSIYHPCHTHERYWLPRVSLGFLRLNFRGLSATTCTFVCCEGHDAVEYI